MTEPAPRLRLVEDPEVTRLRAEVARYKRMLAAAEVDIENLQVELRSKRIQISQLKNDRERKDTADENYETAYRIWEYWRAKLHPNARTFSHEQFKAVKARLSDTLPDSSEPAYSPRYLCEAILGAVAEAHVSASGKRYDDLELICRSPAKLEDFHARYERWKARCERDPSGGPAGGG